MNIVFYRFKVYVKLFLGVLFLIISLASYSNAGINDYCSSPPFLTGYISPNVLFVVDVSGSMSGSSYNPSSTGNGWCDTKYEICTRKSTGNEEGYFTPNRIYRFRKNRYTYWWGDVWDGYWEDPDSIQKDIPSECPSSFRDISNMNEYTGACLNFIYMSRMDLIRWAVTGGKPDSCGQSYCGSNPDCTTGNDAPKYCDFEMYNSSGDKLSCDSYGCVLKCGYLISGTTHKRTKVKVPWSRIKQALIFRFENSDRRPRLGAMLYSNKGIRNDKVYIGDFKDSNSIDVSHPYKNFSTTINYETPRHGTPTAPAMWDAYHYFEQLDPSYGGFEPQSGTSDKWRNPMYQCFDKNNDGECESDEFKLIPCAKNFIVLMTDGQWNVGGKPTPYLTCTIKTGYETYSADPVVPAYYLHKKGFVNKKTNIYSRVSSIYSIGLWLGGTGERSLKNIAMYGSFDVNHGKWPGDLTGYPWNVCWVDDCSVYEDEDGRGSPCTPLPPSSPDWDKNGDGIPDTFFSAKSASEIADALKNAFRDILKRISSGGATSVLTSSGESGANIVKALFYPKEYFDNQTEVDWTGKLYNLWFYLGPFTQNVREDTANNICVGEKCLNLKEDNVLDIYFNDSTGSVEVKVCPDLNGDGKIDTYTDASGAVVDESTYCKVESLSDIKPLWEAGKVLWSTSPDDRVIFTGLNLDNNSAIDINDSFSTKYDKELEPYLDTDNITFADDIINYIRGYDISGFRSRKATIGTTSGVWKLGDIVYSTPKIATYSPFTPLNAYYKDYGDKSYKAFLDSLNYDNLSMVFVGANDGMLHAFRMGELSFPGGGMLAALKKPKGGYGSEAWAFIPKNILPYLKYYMDKNYCHLYYVDLTPYIFDASINGTPDETKSASSWRRILVGGLRFGGACGDNVTGAVTPPNDTGKVPAGVGMSSYFALDITDPENPKLLWEFTDKDLGFTTTGPAIIHIPYKKADGSDDNTKNGYWYVAFASGPDNYDGSVHRPLYMYVLNLKDGTLLRKLQLSGNGKLLGNIDAFAGRMVGSQTDLGVNYSDDAFYFGYTYNDSGVWKGGVVRAATGDDNDVDDWTVSKLISDIGPVTASIAHIEDTKNGNLWLFFGEGRYFTKSDDPDGLRHLYGIKDPCYSAGKLPLTCTKSVSFDELTDVTDNPSANISSPGWYITLQGKDSTYNAERLITDPIVNPVNGWVFFTTFRPTGDICGFGGDTYEWAVGYANGGKAYNLAGSIFLQTSTGTITKINLSQAFSDNTAATSYGRKIATPVKGNPPLAIGGTILVPPPPLEKIIHWRQGFVK